MARLLVPPLLLGRPIDGAPLSPPKEMHSTYKRTPNTRSISVLLSAPLVLVAGLIVLSFALFDTQWFSTIYTSAADVTAPTLTGQFAPVASDPTAQLPQSIKTVQTPQTPVEPRAPRAIPVTLLFDHEANNFGQSIFLTGTARRFGSNRLAYRIVDVDTRSPANNSWQTRANTPSQQFTSGGAIPKPCVLVTSRPKFAFQWKVANVPQCSLYLIKDEFCNTTSLAQEQVRVDFRQYDDDEKKGLNGGRGIYMPLGPRTDFYEAMLQSLADAAMDETPASGYKPMVAMPTQGVASPWHSFRELPPHLLPSSKRSLVLNAIFSRDTSVSRDTLATVLESHAMLEMTARSKIQIASKWSNDLSAGQMNPRQYLEALKHSVFTLTPSGHNPESYRLFEAVEAGSIPIIALDDFYTTHPCKDGLGMLKRSASQSIVWINDWSELPATLAKLLADPEKLDDMQRGLRVWYEAFMSNRVGSLEDALLADMRRGL